MTKTLDIFISSKMAELKAERDVLYDLIPSLNYGDIQLRAWVFENDAPASNQSIRDVYLKALKDSALYIGLFWNQYGEYTVDEFDRASEWGIERHIYVKDVEADKRAPELKEFLNKHGSVTDGITAKWFKTTDELCEVVKQSLDKWMKGYLSGPRGDTSARLYRNAGEILERPKKLIGRDDLLQDIKRLFEQGQQVLLQGFSGSGKSALAAEIAAGHCPALWLRTGRNDADELFEGLAREFNAQEAISKASGDEKVRVMRLILAQSGIKLLVLDDVWNGQALQTLVKAVPPSVHLLVTSRRRYGIDSIVEVGDLPPKSATELLGFHANQDYSSHAQARELCHILGHLAFAIRIAGLTLKMNVWNPAELAKKILDVPHELATPLDFIEIGRENVAKLIQVSLNALDAEARAVYAAMGAFFAPQMTSLIITDFIKRTRVVDEKMLMNFRKRYPENTHLSDDEIRQGIQKALSEKINAGLLENHLTTLVQHGLVSPIPATENAIAAYRLHDLAYSYARTQNGDEQRRRALDTCLAYVEHYKQPTLPNFAALRPELDNLLNAAGWAFGAGQIEQAEDFVDKLYIGPQANGGFLFYQGLASHAIRLMEQAADTTGRVGKKQNQGAHLGNLGLAYSDLGRFEKAIEYHKQALMIRREFADRRGEGQDLGNLGSVYLSLGQFEKAIGYYEQALMIRREIGDRPGEGQDLGNLGNVYLSLGQVKKAIGYYEQALMIRREIGDRHGEGVGLGYLGNAYYSLGQVEKAIGYYERALTISREIGNRPGEGNVLGNLGNAYSALGQVEKAIGYLEQALMISREIGDKRNDGSQLGNLGNAYSALGQVEQAIEYYEQALSISREIGDRPGEGNRLGNLGSAYNALGQVEKAIGYLEQALTISREIGDKRGEGNALGNLAIAYCSPGQYEKAADYYKQSIQIRREIGDSIGEAKDLNNIGALREAQGDYAAALDYYQQARAIRVEIGAQHLVKQVDENIARVRELMGGGDDNAAKTEDQTSQMLQALMKIYREQGEDILRGALKEGGMGNEVIEKVVTLLKGMADEGEP